MSRRKSLPLTEGKTKSNVKLNPPLRKSAPPPPPIIPRNSKSPQELLVFEIDRALQLLVDTCETTAKKLSGDFVPIDMLKMYKKTLIDNYKEGLKVNPNFK